VGAWDGETPWVASDERRVGQMGGGWVVAGKGVAAAGRADFRGRVFGGGCGEDV
jgi:hypothetical protein